jgi:hypothetical protein
MKFKCSISKFSLNLHIKSFQHIWFLKIGKFVKLQLLLAIKFSCIYCGSLLLKGAFGCLNSQNKLKLSPF